MFFKSIFGLAAVTACFLQLTGAAKAQFGAVQGCRLEGGERIGIDTFTFDIYMRVGERCFQQFSAPSIQGVGEMTAPKCGKLIIKFDNMYGWDFTAYSTPCVDNFVLAVVGQETTLFYQYTVNIAP